MSECTARSFRVRLAAAPKPERVVRPAIAGDHAERVLRIAADLFDVRAAVLVVGDAVNSRVARAWARDGWNESDAVEAARLLFDALSAAPAATSPAVLEDLAPGRGFRAAAPVIAADGRRIGAICLLDPDRLALLSGLQRRLIAEFGGLIRPACEALPPAPAPGLGAAVDRADSPDR